MNDYIGVDLGAYQVCMSSSSEIDDDHIFLSWIVRSMEQDTFIGQYDHEYQDALNKGHNIHHNFFKDAYSKQSPDFNESAYDAVTEIFAKIVALNPSVATTDKLLITIPQYFKPQQILAIHEIAKELGIKKIETLSQALSKAIFLAKKFRHEIGEKFAVLDWGASQFEFGVFQVTSEYQVKKVVNSSVEGVGGYQCSELLRDMVATKYYQQRKRKLTIADFSSLDPQVRGVLEGFKDHDERAINIWGEFYFNLKRDEYFEKVYSLIAPTFTKINEMLAEHSVMTVYCTGGFTQLEIFKNILSKHISVDMVDVFQIDMAAKGGILYLKGLDQQLKLDEEKKEIESQLKLEKEKKLAKENQIKETPINAVTAVEFNDHTRIDLGNTKSSDTNEKIESNEHIEPIAPDTDIFDFLFSTKGRVARGQYFIYSLIHFVTIMMITFIAQKMWILVVCAGIGAIISIIVSIKRMHDIDMTGYFLWTLLIPYFNIVPVIILFFVKGTKGSNKYGVDPLSLLNSQTATTINSQASSKVSLQAYPPDQITAQSSLETPLPQAVPSSAPIDSTKKILATGMGVVFLLMIFGFGVAVFLQSDKKEKEEILPLEALERVDDTINIYTDEIAQIEAAAMAVEDSEIINTSEVDVGENRVEKPQLEQGMRWNVKTIDLRRPQDSYDNVEFVLTGIDHDSYFFNKTVKGRSNTTTELIYDHNLNLYEGVTGTYSPTLTYYDFPLYPGKKWEIQSNVYNNKYKDIQVSKGEVMGWEAISSEYWADIHAIKVDIEFISYKDGKEVLRGRDISWYAPSIGRAVKTEEYAWNSTTSRWEKGREHYVFNFTKL